MRSSELVPVKPDNLPLEVYLECKIFLRKQVDSFAFRKADTFSLLYENQTVTPEMAGRLKRAAFPKNLVYIPRQYVVETLFAQGYLLGFDEEMITAIRNGESPWDEDEITEIPDKMPVIDNLHESEYYFNLEKTTKKYNETKAAAKELIDEARETGKVDRKQADEVSMGILRQVNETEASLIIRSINRIRSVDEYLHSHSLNVAYLNGLIGKWMKFDEKKESDLIETGLLHDIGKLMVAPEILNKPARLTTMEFDAIKKHPVYSLEMLEKSGVSKSVVLGGVIQHHEKVNGTGYPYGLDVKNITEFARITAISDIYDAMVTKRVYKDPHSPFEILNEFASEGYSELDIKYVSIFIDCMIEELKGKRVIMNDESIATVKLINPRNLLYPLVEVDGKAVETSDDFHCVRMYDGLR